MGRGRPARRRPRERPPRPRGEEGGRLLDPRLDHARVVPVRLRARPDRGDRRPRLREQLGPRRRLRDRSLGGGRRSGRGRRAAGEDRVGAGRPRRSPPRSHLRGLARAGGARPRARRRPSAGPHRGRGGSRRGRPVHLHLHVGDDRPAQGLHDPPPQLLRDGGRGRQDAEQLRRPRRHTAPLPSARPQLRPPDPPPGAICRVHARPVPRPAACRRGTCRSAPDHLPERAARLREDPHRGRLRPRRRRRPEARDRRMGAPRRHGRQPPAPGRRVDSARPRAPACGSQTASSTRR